MYLLLGPVTYNQFYGLLGTGVFNSDGAHHLLAFGFPLTHELPGEMWKFVIPLDREILVTCSSVLLDSTEA